MTGSRTLAILIAAIPIWMVIGAYVATVQENHGYLKSVADDIGQFVFKFGWFLTAVAMLVWWLW